MTLKQVADMRVACRQLSADMRRERNVQLVRHAGVRQAAGKKDTFHVLPKEHLWTTKNPGLLPLKKRFCTSKVQFLYSKQARTNRSTDDNPSSKFTALRARLPVSWTLGAAVEAHLPLQLGHVAEVRLERLQCQVRLRLLFPAEKDAKDRCAGSESHSPTSFYFVVFLGFQSTTVPYPPIKVLNLD